MHRVEVFITTYNNPERLNENLVRFHQTTRNIPNVDFHINVISNHPILQITTWVDKCYHNKLRPTNHPGHLSRDYNAAIVYAFQSLREPAVDQVICCHDDIIWHDDWYQRLSEIHQTYSFYAGDYGCSLTSWTPEAVKQIGLWDERFVGLGYHEADLFLRARIFNGDKSSINDHYGGRVWNPTSVIFDHPPANQGKIDHSSASVQYHTISRKVFAAKWNCHPEQWSTRLTEVPTKPLIPGFLFHPQFELDVQTLDAQNYLYQPAGLEHFLEEWK